MNDISDLFEPAGRINFIPPENWDKKKFEILLIGVGGGGSHLTPMVARAMSIYQDVPTKLTLVDPDIVEEKNLSRQNFVMADLGKKKAEVLATRYSRSYGVEISAKAELVDEPSDIEALITGSLYETCLTIISAVDNLPSRKLIHDFLSERAESNFTCYWLDLGGEEFHGQIAIGSSFGNSYYEKDYQDVTTPWITEVYPDILKDAGDIKPSQLPCGIGAAQAVNRNISGSVLAMNPILALFESYAQKKNLMPDYHLIEYGINPPVVRVRRNTKRELELATWAGRYGFISSLTGKSHEHIYLHGLMQEPGRLAA